MIRLAGFSDFEEIGRGGFGVVYRATQPALGRQVAIKVLSAELTDSTARRRFQREAKAMGVLSGHPNILQIHEAGFTPEGRPYLVMPYLPGRSLGARIRGDGPLQVEAAVDVGVKLAAALATAHKAGLVHRDVKPDNVIYDAFDEPVLGDFGIASALGSTATKTGQVTASLAYAAPEVIDGQRPGVVADVYSLSATIFAALHGTGPFVRENDVSTAQVLARILTAPPPDLRENGVADEVAAALEAGLAKDPDDRPQSVEELGEMLQEAQGLLGFATTPLRIPDISPVDVTFTTHTEPEPEPARDVAPARSPVERTTADVDAEELPDGSASDTVDHGLDGATVVRKASRSGDLPASPGGATEDLDAAATPPEEARKSRRGLLIGGLALLVLVAGGIGAFLLIGSPDAAQDEAEGLQITGLPGRVFSRIEDPDVLRADLDGADSDSESVLEGRLIGAWWGMADWCLEEGVDRAAPCYDIAADYLTELRQDPRALTIATSSTPRASVVEAVEDGYSIVLDALDSRRDVPEDLALQERPGNGQLCVPDCADIADEIVALGATEEPEPTETATPEAEPTETEEPFSGPEQELRPVSAVATAERRPVNLRCTGEVITYTARNLIDDDEQTGWGAGEDDGTGVSITIDLGEELRLTRVGMTPGYTKFGPRQDTQCTPVSAFDRNRFVTGVRYSFDDGTSVTQSFDNEPTIQFIATDVVTRRVVITVLGTIREPGVDNDTIISEAVFFGRR